MRIPRVYLEGTLPDAGTMTLAEAQSHYLCKVLRLEAGRPLQVFDGSGAEFSAQIELADKRATLIRISDKALVNRESNLTTHLAIGISRGERMDWVLQKATELGVTRITPLFTERTEVKLRGERLEKKMAHWRQIAISACEQCQRNVLPIIDDACSLSEFYRGHNDGLKLILHHRSQQSLKQMPVPRAVTLLIGPEGGLTEVEIDAALQQHQYQPLTLGPRVLRTETAPIAALTAVQLQWGDLG